MARLDSVINDHRKRKENCCKHEAVIAKGNYIQLEDYSLILFVSLGHYLFCKFNDGVKMWVVLLVRLGEVVINV